MELNIQALARLQLSSRSVNVLDSVILSARPGATPERSAIKYNVNQARYPFPLRIQSGRVTFTAQIISNNRMVLFQGQTTVDINSRFGFDLRVDPTDSAFLVVEPDSLQLLARTTDTIVVLNRGGRALQWSARNVPNTLLVAPSSGTIAANDSTFVRVSSVGSSPSRNVIDITSNVGDVSIPIIVTMPPTPTVAITSITTPGGQSVNAGNVQGSVDVMVQVNAPGAFAEDSALLALANTTVCTRALAGSAMPVTFTCSINTAEYAATTGSVRYPNGPYPLTARVIRNANVLAEESRPLVLNNVSFLIATHRSSRGVAPGGTSPGPGNLAPANTSWLAGDLTFDVLQVNFAGPTGQLGSVTATLVTGGNGVHGGVGCQPASTRGSNPTIAQVDGGSGPLTPSAVANGIVANTNGTTPNCGSRAGSRSIPATAGGVTSIVFSETALLASGGVDDIEDVILVMLTGVTAVGQPGETRCINPDPATNPISNCGTGSGGSRPNEAGYIFVDNLSPRITNFDVVTNTCPTSGTCWINTPRAIIGDSAAGVTSFRSVDYGVSRQTAEFTYGPASGSQTVVPTAFSTNHETLPTSPVFAAVNVTDGLGNSSGARFAMASPLSTSSSTTGAQSLGIDVTPPLCAFAAAPDSGVVLANEINPEAGDVFRIVMSDSRSGLAVNPIAWSQIGHRPGAIDCIFGTGTGCAPASGDVDNPFNPGDVDRYVVQTANVRDAAGNVCAATRTALDDDTAPLPAGVVTHGTISPGNNPLLFTTTASDNIDLRVAHLLIDYDTVLQNLFIDSAVVGGYGFPPFTTTSTININNPSFIRSIELTNAAGRPIGATQVASHVEVRIFDVASNASPPSLTNIAAAVTASGALGSFAANHPNLDTLRATSSQTTLCTTTPACPMTTTLTMFARGPAAIFANPFARVLFIVVAPNAVANVLGVAGPPTATEGLFGRTFTWTFAWTPSGYAPGLYRILAIGVDSQGRALRTNVINHLLL